VNTPDRDELVFMLMFIADEEVLLMLDKEDDPEVRGLVEGEAIRRGIRTSDFAPLI
jgi:hypothetical protein